MNTALEVSLTVERPQTLSQMFKVFLVGPLPRFRFAIFIADLIPARHSHLQYRLIMTTSC